VVYGVIVHAAPLFNAVSMPAGKGVILIPYGHVKKAIQLDAVKFVACLAAVDMDVRLLAIP
jgi:hypothetical protein